MRPSGQQRQRVHLSQLVPVTISPRAARILTLWRLPTARLRPIPSSAPALRQFPDLRFGWTPPPDPGARNWKLCLTLETTTGNYLTFFLPPGANQNRADVVDRGPKRPRRMISAGSSPTRCTAAACLLAAICKRSGCLQHRAKPANSAQDAVRGFGGSTVFRGRGQRSRSLRGAGPSRRVGQDRIRARVGMGRGCGF
jgi:hypothetical protein